MRRRAALRVGRRQNQEDETRSRGYGSMTILGWLLLGLIAGFLASTVMRGGFGLIGDIIVGIVGAFIGGFLFTVLTGNANPVDDFDIGSIFVAFVGACILIAILRAVSGRRARI
jgi:uncharacterized membrane protein YeaQ/YmgE (transglycosylase-associated protein family)